VDQARIRCRHWWLHCGDPSRCRRQSIGVAAYYPHPWTSEQITAKPCGSCIQSLTFSVSRSPRGCSETLGGRRFSFNGLLVRSTPQRLCGFVMKLFVYYRQRMCTTL
jgi:hypothetical protein